MKTSNVSSACYSAEMTGLGVGGGGLYGGPGHPTGLDCPAGVMGCGCGGNVVSACRSGAPEPVLTNPSNGAPVTSMVRAGGCCGLTVGGEVCVAVGRERTLYSVVNTVPFHYINEGGPVH